MGSMGISHWIILAILALLLFGRGKVSDLMGDVAKGIKAFKKGMQDDDVTTETSESTKSIEHKTEAPAARSDVGSKAV